MNTHSLLLDPFSKLMWKLDQAVAFNISAVIRVEGDFSDDDIRLGLAALQKRHPLLRARIDGTNPKEPRYRFDVTDAIPFRSVDAPESEIWNCFCDELGRKFDAERGPWIRFVRLDHGPKDASLIMTFDHVIGDGASIFPILQGLVRGISSVEARATLEEEGKGAEPVLAWDRMPQALTGTRGALASASYVQRHLRRDIKFGKPIRVGDTSVTPDQRSPKAIPLRLEAERIETLVKQAWSATRHFKVC
ncbi:MAG: condensation domain-containing protein [Polyangiales bacterium]